MDEPKKVTFNAFDRNAEIEFSQRNLPHWFQVGAAMFITFRSADSLPREVLIRMQRELEAWLSTKNLPIEIASSLFGVKLPNHDELLDSLVAADRKQLRKLADQLFHVALDECHGKCVLKQPNIASIVANAILHRDGESYDLDCFVVMPNHVHAIVQFRTDSGKSIVGQSWMRYSARLINPQIDESGAFWQPEPFDHVIRSPSECHDRIPNYGNGDLFHANRSIRRVLDPQGNWRFSHRNLAANTKRKSIRGKTLSEP